MGRTAGGTLDVAGSAVGTQAVSSYNGYQEYAIDFSATAGQSITVWYAAPVMPPRYPAAFQEDTWSNLDVVRLTKK